MTELLFENEWKKFLKDELPRKFDKYDHNDTRDGPGHLLVTAVNAIRTGDATAFFNTLDDQYMDWWGDQVYYSFKERMPEFIKYLRSVYTWENQRDEEAELEEVEADEDHEYRLILEDMLLERMNDNWQVLLCNFPLFVWNVDNQVSLGWIDAEQDAESELADNEELRNFLAQSGLSEGEKWELIANGMSYDVQGIIGGIVDAGDILNAMVNGNTSLQVDQTVVALHNGFEGSGYYIKPTGSIRINPKKKMNVDFGSYSLGDVFGTIDWFWWAR